MVSALAARPPVMPSAAIKCSMALGRANGLAAAGAGTGLRIALGRPSIDLQVRTMANYRHKKIIKLAKGYRGRSNTYTLALMRVHKARQYAYRDRKVKKREFRSLWIQRINAGVRQYGLHNFTYSHFMNRLSKSNVTLNRKVLADIAITEPLSFRSVMEVAKAAA
jgi:large subunit ribosomal protein L20